ncbi:DUF2922 domain-containing protein [Ectobacillus panaciterrae]|uniref:DUF2922 domain-containing protein n=1 Tax=Ectobacillus panaciterrae TaxID=363872 RepID=UPI0003F8951F|nr:DUF2922 domain-containing protein [Ectobacillus panaciterrae]
MQVLELQFLKEDGKTATFTVDNPNTPIDKAAVNAAMDKILSAGVFRTLGPNSRKKGARLVDRTVTEIDLGV